MILEHGWTLASKFWPRYVKPFYSKKMYRHITIRIRGLSTYRLTNLFPDTIFLSVIYLLQSDWSNILVIFFFFLNGPTPASFSFIFIFSNTHYKFYNKYICEKMSIQYRVWGFKQTTFRTQVSSYNH